MLKEHKEVTDQQVLKDNKVLLDYQGLQDLQDQQALKVGHKEHKVL